MGAPTAQGGTHRSASGSFLQLCGQRNGTSVFPVSSVEGAEAGL